MLITIISFSRKSLNLRVKSKKEAYKMLEDDFDPDTAARLQSWLLNMGFSRPTSRDHLQSICRGNHRAVWENLTKQVQPRPEVKNQRLQIFVANVKHSKSFRDDIHERILSGVTCEELDVWRETQSLRQQVAEAEARVAAAKQDIHSITVALAEKISIREHLGTGVKNMKRQSSALQAATEQYQNRSNKLSEMINITDHLSTTPTPTNVNQVVDKCVALLLEASSKKATEISRQEVAHKLANQFNSTALSNCSVVSEGDRRDQDQLDTQEKYLENIEGVSVSEIWEVLFKKQDSLITEMVNSSDTHPNSAAKSGSQSVLAEISALHCKLVLRTLETKRRTSLLEKKLVQIMTEAVVGESNEEAARELLVLRCEEVGLSGRVTVLHNELSALKHQSGLYQVQSHSAEEGSLESVLSAISTIDRDLITKKSEVEALLMAGEYTGAKIGNVVTQIETLIQKDNSGRKGYDVSLNSNYDEFLQHFRPKGPDATLSHRIAELKEFYSASQPECRNLSFDLDSLAEADTSACEVPGLIGELRYFLEKFSLYANRKLVLSNGQSLWITETLEQHQSKKHHSSKQKVGFEILQSQTMEGLLERYEAGAQLQISVGWTTPHLFDVSSKQHSHCAKLELMLKSSKDSISTLQQTSAHLDLGLNNLKWWDSAQTHIGEARLVNGRPFHYYQNVCLEYKKSNL